VIDSVGNVSSLLAVGPSNPLVLATIDRLTGPRLKQAVLLDFDEVRLTRAATRVQKYGVPDVIAEHYEPDRPIQQASLIASAFGRRDIDVVIVGLTPASADSAATVPNAQESIQVLRSTLIDSLTFAEAALSSLTQQGHGILVVFSHSALSTAPGLDRPYCAAMAGLGTLVSSLAERAEDTGVRVVSVRIAPTADPSATDEEHNSAWVRPADVASAIAAEVRTTRRNVRNTTLTLPKTWRRMMPSQRN
jgi:NAD(P)-dependent dehydrogenase (short-subunit alcohol dehydrogenase family)